MKKDEKLVELAQKIYKDLQQEWNVSYDASGSVGRRYARNDEIGTPFCVTVDFETLDDNTVTVRDRDSREQKRIKIKDLKEEIRKKLCLC